MEVLNTSTLFPLLIAFIFILLSLPKRPKNKKLPPGPRPFPIIGSLHKIGDNAHRSLNDLAKIYGPIMSLKLGFTTTVVISSSDTAREILQIHDHAFSSRFVPDALHARDLSKHSVVWLPAVATRWKGLRKILHSHILSVSSLDANQHLRAKKVEDLILYCKKSSELGEPVDIALAGFTTALNVISNTLFSTDLADPFQGSAKEFQDLVWNMMAEIGKPNLVDFFPMLKTVDPQGIRRRMVVYCDKILHMFEEMTDRRLELRKLFKSDESSRNDVLDVFLNIAQQKPDEIDLTHMKIMFLDLFVTGTATTSSSLEWAMAELLRNQEIMVKAKAELEQVIGKGKIVEDADISGLPYLGCIVKETLRLHPPAPFVIRQKVETDIEACGYVVPKDAQIIVNVWAIGRDPSLWEDPLLFKPERFLGSRIDVKGQDFELIPFGAGRRICPGSQLATRMVSVMLGSMINCFDWKLEGGIEPNNLDMGEKFGLAMQKAHPLIALPTIISV